MNRIKKDQKLRIILNGSHFLYIRVRDIEDQMLPIREAFQHLINIRKNSPAVGLTYNYPAGPRWEAGYLQINL